ncbi:MAG: beta-galactosidase [Peptococcaceae bacterium]|nr:beta-galactosidase [Peptococcaceae bacterium]
MFNRFLTLIIAVFLLSSLSLTFIWKDATAREIFGDSPVTSVYRISQDLGGKWDNFSSLRQAWAEENRKSQGDEHKGVALFNQKSMIIPSDQGFHVAVKRFKVTGKWGYKTAQLVLSGVYGKARVFLNGIDDANYLGEFEGVGGTYYLDISSTRFDFNKENVLYIELSKSGLQQKKMLGWLWPEYGRITGEIRLEAVSETTIDYTKTTVAYDLENKKLILNTGLKHHLTLDHGPWAINGVLKDKDQKAAECLLPLNSNGEYEQGITLVFELPDPKFWSPDNPYLYELNLVLSNSEGDYDSVQFPIGIKKVTGSNQRWILNGKNFEVKGEIISSQQGYLIRNQQQLEDYLKKSKAQGMNLIYFMGFFPDESWLFCADRLGMGVWLEMPADFISKEKIPSYTQFQELLLISERHPSVLALTAGKELESSPKTEDYFREITKRIPTLPVYHMKIFADNEKKDLQTNILTGNGLQGEWGKVSFNKSFPDEDKNNTSWEKEIIAAIIWFLWLLFLFIQRVVSGKWNYTDLFNDRPKRAVRVALFWGTLGFISRMVTLAAVIVSLLFVIPLQLLVRIPYDMSAPVSVRSQPPLLLWLLLSFFFILIKIFQAGLAEAWLSQKPGALGFCCWLERRSNWILFAGAAWIISVYWKVWYLPLIVYAAFTFLLFPLRVKDVWKAGGKYRSVLILPMTLLCGIAVMIFSHWSDFRYLFQIALPLMKVLLSSIFSM